MKILKKKSYETGLDHFDRIQQTTVYMPVSWHFGSEQWLVQLAKPLPNCMNCSSHFPVLHDKIHPHDKRANGFSAGERQKEEWWQRASVTWTAGPSGWQQAELPIAICLHWWEHQWGCCHLCAACANQGRGEQDLELGAAQLPVLPLATSLASALGKMVLW